MHGGALQHTVRYLAPRCRMCSIACSSIRDGHCMQKGTDAMDAVPREAGISGRSKAANHRPCATQAAGRPSLLCTTLALASHPGIEYQLLGTLPHKAAASTQHAP
jgi:hypothetical protein